MEVKLLHPANAYEPINLIELGKFIEFRALHPAMDNDSRESTEDGIVSVVKKLQ